MNKILRFATYLQDVESNIEKKKKLKNEKNKLKQNDNVIGQQLHDYYVKMRNHTTFLKN